MTRGLSSFGCSFWTLIYCDCSFFDQKKSTDTGDYLPEGYQDDLEFSEGMLGSQAGLSSKQRREGPELPGMENLGADAIMSGGIEVAEGIPEGMEFIPSSVPDGNFEIPVSITTAGESHSFFVVGKNHTHTMSNAILLRVLKLV